MSRHVYDRSDAGALGRLGGDLLTAAMEVVLRGTAVVMAVGAWRRGEPYDLNPLRTAPRRARTDQPIK